MNSHTNPVLAQFRVDPDKWGPDGFAEWIVYHTPTEYEYAGFGWTRVEMEQAVRVIGRLQQMRESNMGIPDRTIATYELGVGS